MDNNKQVAEEIIKLREEIRVLVEKKGSEQNSELAALVSYMTDEREKTNKVLAGLFERIKRLEYRASVAKEENPIEVLRKKGFEEIALSRLDSGIIDFIQTKGLVCADDIKDLMGYRGRNAACTRLKRLCDEGLLHRIQLGHKVYYRFDAGKATNALIISPPQ